MQNYAFEMNDVSIRYPHFKMEGLNLSLPQGQVMGLVGVNGAGKSTTIRILMGLVKADSGQVKALGYNLPEHQVQAKYDIGFASDDMRLYKSQTLQWHMDFIKSIYPKFDSAYAADLLKRFDLIADQQIKGISHGQRVKACLLLVLARRPKLLILDEPTTGLDPVAREEVICELADILLDDERSVLFSSHNTHDIEKLSDQIAFLDRGKLLALQDKESYLESWARFRCQINNTSSESVLGAVSIKRNGQIAEIVTAQYSPHYVAQLQQAGFSVLEQHRMSLEEIFVANIKRSR
ncbi:ABC transporter ATP-binding protein [Paraglaciecola hydrolytica]|uniref:ABC transporter n=1 Tax=Paraglaciecola hydrolytica TaxID=1799789 RepID=A0A148KLP4_9ALTE|nr:ABC transporter ATP-binding protein [Paraglaciecola hydrolytica]KXI27243.1 ABC transporter [Paraglaciecola hydrolytica]